MTAALLRLPPAGFILSTLIALYLLPGMFGHDPWKTEDAIGFGVVHAMLSQGQLYPLALAGEPYVASGPLYFWLAAAAAKCFGLLIPAHDAARIASLVCVGLALHFTRLAARELYGPDGGNLSLLTLMGSLGLLIHARETASATGALAGVAAAYFGIAMARRSTFKSGIALGLGATVAFLTEGLPALLPPMVAALVLIPFAIADHERRYVRAVGLGFVICTFITVAWLVWAHRQYPAYQSAWLDAQFAKLAGRPQAVISLDYLKTLAWTAWPAWPLALWAIWAYRRRFRNPDFVVPFVAAFVSILVVLFTSASRELDALVLLVPLAIPAGAVAIQLRRGAANALASFSLMSTVLLAALLWIMWIAMMTGVPAQLATNVAKLEPGYVVAFNPLALAVALILSALWYGYVMRIERSTLRAIPLWTSGMVLVWGLAMTLWIGWIDYGKSYRSVVAGAVAAVASSAPRSGCIASVGLGETQRAVFHYHGGLVTERLETGRGSQCNTLLAQARIGSAEPAPGPGWTQVWEGARPRDRERYRLYYRN